jgi:hypothetical protein
MQDAVTIRLQALRRRYVTLAFLHGGALAQTALLLGMLLVCGLDYLLDFPLPLRAIGLLVCLVSAGVTLWRHMLRPLLRVPDQEGLALTVEHTYPELSSRLISAVQFQAAGVAVGTSPTLVQAVIQQAQSVIGDLDWVQVLPSRALRRASFWGAVVLLSCGVITVATWPTSSILLQRFCLLSVKLPTRTQITSVTGNVYVAVGDSLNLEALVTGWYASAVRAELKYPDRRQILPMTASASGGRRFVGVIDNAQESFSYVLYAGDGYSLTHKVQVMTRPALVQVEFAQRYPAYIPLPVRPLAVNDLTMVQGSSLQLTLTANRACRGQDSSGAAGSVVIVHTPERKISLPMQVDAQQPTQLQALVPLPDNAIGVSIRLVDSNGIASLDSVMYRIQMVPDATPKIRVLWPTAHEQTIVAAGTVPMRLQTEDDYGVRQIRLYYRLGENEPQSVPVYTRAPNLIEPRWQGEYIWDLAQANFPTALAPDSRIEFWLEIADGKTPQPNTQRSDTYSLVVVTSEVKHAELISRLGSSLNQVHDMATEQENTSQDLGKIITDKNAATQPAPGRP